MRADFDVVVVGAGPAGSATALRLARSGCRVALVERTLFRNPRVGESLAPIVQPLLVDLGVWPDFLGLRPLPSYGTRSVWGADAPEDHSHISTPWGCGWHVDRVEFDRLLADCAVDAGATMFGGTSLVDCSEKDSGWRLVLRRQYPLSSAAAESVLRARVLVDATGRAAHLAVRLGAQRFKFDRLVGIAALFEGGTAQQGFVQVEAIADGWWYTAPVPPCYMMAMLMTDSDISGNAHLASLSEWKRRMKTAPATLSRLGSRNVSWGPKVFSAASQRLQRRDRDHKCIAVGDAALAVDPISGSGVIRALRFAQSGAETALALLENRTAEAIESYEAANDLLCIDYLSERAAYYGIERRWPNALFWKRRTPTAVQENRNLPA
jgi:flavin-dependent dehydrogenase